MAPSPGAPSGPTASSATTPAGTGRQPPATSSIRRPKVKDALEWAGTLFESRGWRAEVWSGTHPVVVANVRFLAGYRREALLDPARIALVADTVESGDTACWSPSR